MINVKRIVTVILLVMLVMLFVTPAVAAELNEVTFNDSKITVSGSCTTSNQVQVIVFDYNNEPIYFSTITVVDDAFNVTLDADFNLEEGKTYTVKVADYDGENVSQGTFTVEPENLGHTHSFESMWEYDNTKHWHECACGEKSDTEVHSFGEWTIVKAATTTEDGSEKRICSVCGYEETNVIPANETSPQTGDTVNLLLWITLLLVSGGFLTILCLANTKNRKQRRQ